MGAEIQLWTKGHGKQLAKVTTTLEVTTCWCGVPVGVPANLLRYARNHARQEVYCPLGHAFTFIRTNEDRLRDERERSSVLRAQLDQAAAETRAQKAAKTRFKRERDNLRTRAAGGVCPCCNRTFKQLARHMDSQHPEWPEA